MKYITDIFSLFFSLFFVFFEWVWTKEVIMYNLFGMNSDQQVNYVKNTLKQ